MAVLTADVARILLRYEPDTGKLFWRERPREFFSTDRNWRMWNTRYAGAEAFTFTDALGYKRGAIFDEHQSAHRVIWAIQTGNWPAFVIDHINGNPSDNRWENLRDVPRVLNQRNSKRRSDNKSGVTGVHWFRPHQKWCAKIKDSGRERHLGYFDSVEEAAAARAVAEKELGYGPHHGSAA